MTLVALVAILGAKKKISSNWNLRNLYITYDKYRTSSKIKYQLNEIDYELYIYNIFKTEIKT